MEIVEIEVVHEGALEAMHEGEMGVVHEWALEVVCDGALEAMRGGHWRLCSGWKLKWLKWHKFCMLERHIWYIVCIWCIAKKWEEGWRWLKG